MHTSSLVCFAMIALENELQEFQVIRVNPVSALSCKVHLELVSSQLSYGVG